VFAGFKVAAGLEARLGMLPPLWTIAYKIYYLNSLHEPFWHSFYETCFPKDGAPDVLLIKDVRMPLALPAFARMYPDSLFVYLIRNPLFVVASELRTHPFEDLMRWLDRDYLRRTFGQPELVDRFFGKTPEHTFALLWRLENEWVVRELERTQLSRVVCIRYETLSQNLYSSTAALHRQMGLSPHPQTDRFIHFLETVPDAPSHARATSFNPKRAPWLSQPALTSQQLEHAQEVLEGSPIIDWWEGANDANADAGAPFFAPVV
jgi:hypothetical protein